jgi:hypothetical protein
MSSSRRAPVQTGHASRHPSDTCAQSRCNRCNWSAGAHHRGAVAGRSLRLPRRRRRILHPNSSSIVRDVNGVAGTVTANRLMRPKRSESLDPRPDLGGPCAPRLHQHVDVRLGDDEMLAGFGKTLDDTADMVRAKGPA